MSMDNISAKMEKVSNSMPKLGQAHYFQDNPNEKFDAIKDLLNDESDSHKLEGLKRLIAMISKGRNVSSLFPHVVKCVVVDSAEIRRLAHMYITHYAEFEPDAALLCINHFQRDLENHNQLLRAHALRHISSIRLNIITQITLLAIKKAVVDSSPYVRKAACASCCKIYSLDPSKKEELEDPIETLLGDNTTLVLGSAIQAFQEVCPERLDLIHPHYRKICNMLADVDEWGQVSILNLLTRYARTHFDNPDPDQPSTDKKKKKKKGFYSDEEDSDDDGDDLLYNDGFTMDEDHRLLLRAALPLLNSRSSAVVLAVAQLYFYCAPRSEVTKVGKALVAMARNHREISYIIYSNITTMAASRPEIFSPFLTSFFVFDSDPVPIRQFKLEILTYIASENNIGRILREFNVYVHKEEKEFVTATIQAIGRCAAQIREVQEVCMGGLMMLISNRSETVVAESVVVLKKLLQLTAKNDNQPRGDDDDEDEPEQADKQGAIIHLIKLLDDVKIPEARKSILWVVGEYSDKVPLHAPDVLRKTAKTFKTEHTSVKLQILNLGAKLFLRNPQQTALIFQYVLSMAKYDVNYDVRDRARLMRVALFNPNGGAPKLQTASKRLFLAEKPTPTETSPSEDRQRFAMGSLSHIVNHTAPLYQPIEDWTEDPPDPECRDVAPRRQRRDGGAMIGFGSDNAPPSSLGQGTRMRTSDDENWLDSDESYYSSDEYSDDYSRSRSRSRSPYSDEYSDYSRSRTNSRSRSPYSDDSYYSDSYSDYSDYSRSPSPSPPRRKEKAVGGSKSAAAIQPVNDEPAAKADASSNMDDLLGFGFGNTKSAAPLQSSSSTSLDDLLGGTLTPSPVSAQPVVSATATVSSDQSKVELPTFELLRGVLGGGLQIDYQFLRRASLHGSDTNVIQLSFRNTSDRAINNIRCTSNNPDIHAFDTIPVLMARSLYQQTMNIKFTSMTAEASFGISHEMGSYTVSIKPPVGELMCGRAMSDGEFESLRKSLGGLNESSCSLSVTASDIPAEVLRCANLALLSSADGEYRFGGTVMTSGDAVLVTVTSSSLRVNAENALLCSMLIKQLQDVLES